MPAPGTKMPHDSWPRSQNINRSNIVTNSTKTLKMVLIKKKKNFLIKIKRDFFR